MRLDSGPPDKIMVLGILDPMIHNSIHHACKLSLETRLWGGGNFAFHTPSCSLALRLYQAIHFSVVMR